MSHTFTRTGAQIEEIHNTVDNLPNIVSNENLISNSSFENAGSVTSQPDATPRNYNAGDELFQGMFAVGALTGVTYIDGKANGTGQLYTDVYKSEKQKLSTANYVASIANSNGSPVEMGASFVDIGDYWRVTFDMSETFSVKFEQGSVATGHGVKSLTEIYGDPISSFSVSVRALGAIGDGSDATAHFEAAAQAAAKRGSSGKYPTVEVGDGEYLISSSISQQATWVLSPGAIITGLPTVPPTNSHDHSRLTGTVIAYDGINQWTTINIGDPNLTLQKALGKSYSSEIMGQSDNSAGGVTGTSYASARDIVDQSTIGVTGIGFNDNSAVAKVAWGIYGEGIRESDIVGHAFATELTAMSKTGNSVNKADPYTRPSVSDGHTFSAWLTAGGPGDNSYSANITAYIGCLAKGGAQADRGVVFYQDSVSTQEAIVMPYDYSVLNQSYEGSTFNTDRSGSRTRISMQDDNANFSGRVEFIRGGVNGGTPIAGTRLSSVSNYAIIDNTTLANLAERTITMTSNYDAGNNSASIRVDDFVSDASATDKRGTYMTYSIFGPSTANQQNLGSASNIWKEVFAGNTTINPSDERLKQFFSIEGAEKLCAIEIKGIIKKFKWNDAINEKGDNARYHFGVGAQSVRDILVKHGLKPEAYSFLCYDEWEDEFDSEGNMITKAGSSYAIRYAELAMFILSAI